MPIKIYWKTNSVCIWVKEKGMTYKMINWETEISIATTNGIFIKKKFTLNKDYWNIICKERRFVEVSYHDRKRGNDNFLVFFDNNAINHSAYRIKNDKKVKWLYYELFVKYFIEV